MNGNKIYVGNIPYDTSSKDLIALFTQFGEVIETMIITDKRTGRSKGFGFVSFTTPEAAQSAVGFNDQEYNGRKLVVQIANDPK